MSDIRIVGPRPNVSAVAYASLATFVEWMLVIGLLFFFTEAVRFVLLNPGGQGSTVLKDDPVRGPVQLLIFATGGALLVTHWSQSVRAMIAAWPFWLLTGLAVLSAAWSVDRSLTLRHGAWLAATGLLGMHFELRFSLRSQLTLLGVVFGLVVILSAVFIIWYPELGLEPSLHSGAWRGAFIHKNSLGRAMILAALVYALLLPGSRRSRSFLIVALVASFALALLSQSATAPVILVALFALIPLRAALRHVRIPLPTLLVILAVGASLSGWLIYENVDTLLQAIGRDTSLSGRPLLWATVLAEISERPWIGFGLGAFWKGSTGAAATLERIVAWSPGQAHNGFLDVILDTGLAGATALAITMWLMTVRSARAARNITDTAEALWPIGFLAFFVLSNMTESSILRPNTIFWFLFASVCTRLMPPVARGAA